MKFTFTNWTCDHIVQLFAISFHTHVELNREIKATGNSLSYPVWIFTKADFVFGGNSFGVKYIAVWSSHLVAFCCQCLGLIYDFCDWSVKSCNPREERKCHLKLLWSGNVLLRNLLEHLLRSQLSLEVTFRSFG